jgi:hypothetical protein
MSHWSAYNFSRAACRKEMAGGGPGIWASGRNSPSARSGYKTLRHTVGGGERMSAREKTADWPPPLPHDAQRTKTRARAQAGGEGRRSYKPLPTRFRRDGFDYRQIAWEGDAAIYAQTWSGCSDASVCYEVIRIRRREGFQIDGRLVAPAEVYPSSGAWGVDGWTLQNKESAFHKLREIIKARQKESANPVKTSPIQNTKRCSDSAELRGDINNRYDG